MPAPGRRRTRAAVLIAGVLVVAIAAVTADVLGRGTLRRLDWRVHQQVDAHLHDGPLRYAVKVASFTGQRGIVVIPLLVLAVLVARRQRSLRPVIAAFGALVGIAIVVLSLKAGVGRVAPSSGHDRVHAGGSSYPSGHAINAIICWGLVLEFAATLGERVGRLLAPPRRWLITAALAAAAGLSMVALDYHWLTDVLAGWLLGVLALGVVLAVGPVRGRQLSPKPPAGSARPTTPPG